MPHLNDEATPIARLIGPDGRSIVGLAYVWETSELSILWINEPDTAAFIDPKIRSEMLTRAKEATPDDVIAFLRRLRKPSSKSGGEWASCLKEIQIRIALLEPRRSNWEQL